MSLAEQFRARMERHFQDPEYLRDWLALDLSEQILAVLEDEGLSRADLAERLGVSRQYVTKLLNRTPNLTLRSLAEIAAALGRQVTVRLEPLPVLEPPASALLAPREKPASAPKPRRANPRGKRTATVATP